MPGIDKCHEQMKRAFQKAGLQIKSDPSYFMLDGRAVYIDLEVIRPRNGTQETIMLVEVKCFPDHRSTTRDLYIAIGQYLIYRTVIKRANLPHQVYLPVPETIYKQFSMRLYHRLLRRHTSESL